MRREGHDGSPSVMRELMAQALDHGYTLAAARGDDAEPGSDRSRKPRWKQGSIAVLVVLGLLLTVAAIQTRRSAPAAAEERAQLIEQVETETNRVGDLRRRAGELEEEVATLQDRILEKTASGKRLRGELDQLALLAGTSKVSGPGVRIELDDASGAGLTGGDDSGRVLDIDLQHTVNGLWAAGAEAVSINGQRLTSMTPIRGADRAITVRYRPLSRPYVIEAIGDPNTLEARFAEGPGWSWLSSLQAQYHMPLQISSVDELTLNADSGIQIRFVTTEGS